jgi:hypothetical protein
LRRDEDQVSAADDLRGTAFHEAGHVVAAYYLHVPIKHVTIVPTADASGHVASGRFPRNIAARIEEADYASGYGGSIDPATRRWVERQVMFSLAGGLVMERATGLADYEVGSGLVLQSDEAAKDMAAHHGGVAADYLKMIDGGDLHLAVELVDKVCGGESEAGAYMGWLTERTQNLMRTPGFWPAVEAVAGALIERETLSALAARAVIEEALAEFRSARRERFGYRAGPRGRVGAEPPPGSNDG